MFFVMIIFLAKIAHKDLSDVANILDNQPLIVSEWLLLVNF